MPIYLDEDEDDPAYSVEVPGIYESLMPWAQWEYERGGDPRLRRIGEQVTAAPNSWQANTLAALRAGDPVVVQAWIARGHRWVNGGWSNQTFELPWGSEIRHVRVHSDDTVSPLPRRSWQQ